MSAETDELEVLERADALPLCSLCGKEPAEVRDLCRPCWRAHEATEVDLAYERAMEEADDV